MNVLHRRILTLGFLLAAPAAALVAVACSSGGNNTLDNGGSGTGGATVGPTSCSTPNGLQITFSPMYSAYEPMHSYQLPAVVSGVDDSLVTWSASEPGFVTFATDPDTGGTLMTMQKAGTVTIIASAGSLCGSSLLTITAATPDDWTTGSARYNDGVAVHFGPGGGMTSDAGGPACTNCHGPTADGGLFNDVAHTPEQTGGFSDTDMVNIVVDGVVPDGGYFDPSIISYSNWHHLHQWTDITSDEQKGIVVYLRSLTPSSQNGSSDFGGHFGDGGFPQHDGGHFGDGGHAPHDASAD